MATEQAELETLWRDIMNAPNEAERLPLRRRYREALARFRAEQAKGKPSAAGEAPNVFEYHDYRTFLADVLGAGNHEGLAKKTGLSAAYLNGVIDGTRSMTREAMRKLIGALKLSDSEGSFLEQLRILSESNSADERVAALNRIQAFPSYRKTNPAEHETWQYLSHWYSVAIRELALLAGFRADASWIQERLRERVPVPEVRKSLEFLESAGFIRRLESGAIVPSTKEVNCVGGVFAAALGRYHSQMLEIAARAISGVQREERFLTGRTVALSREQYARVRDILAGALKEVEALGSGEQATDEVYHVGLFAVPLTRPAGKGP